MNAAVPGLQQTLSTLASILFDPKLNPTAALLLYGVIGIVLLIILVIAIMLVLGSPEEDDAAEDEAQDADDEAEPLGGEPTTDATPSDEDDDVAAPMEAPLAKTKVTVPPMGPWARLGVSAIAMLVLLAAWAVAGYTTSDPAVCKSCHGSSSKHAQAPAGTDPHAPVSCVACHEPGAVVGRYVTDVPARLAHFATSAFDPEHPDEYGRVTVAACSSCHAAALTGTASNKSRGLRVSHAEPLAASATCLDCHVPRDNVVAAHNAGMAPCLRCHDGKQASAACATCHDEKAAGAARARTAAFAKEQIPEVSCGGCHNQKKDCDPCHGARLPHTNEFKQYAHARAGAVDFWFNGGKACARCHTAKRNPCGRCHSNLLGHGHGTGSALARTHQRGSSRSCDTCHAGTAYSKRRDFCKDVCHTPAAVAASPR